METLKLGIDGLDDIAQIGAGGSSRVYRAIQVELDRPIALKVLKAADDPEVSRRFDRERKAMGRLSLNDGIVPIYSSGVTERGEPYLIMPYYPNGSLQDRIELGPVPWNEAARYVSSAATTMSAAHEAGVVHLDLKPANILLSSDDQPRIADFGIAKLVSEQTLQNNSGQSFTPTFSAPETLLGGTASAASDVYGLAATLWALIAGRPPFRSIDGEDNTLMAVVGRVIHQPPDDLRHIAPDPICSVIEVAMAKDASDRYPTAGDFGRALATAVKRSREIVVPPVLPPPGHGGAEIGGAGPAGYANASAEATVVSPSASPVPNQLASADAGGPRPSPQPPDGGTSLRFDAPVPPRLVPATTSRSAGLADAIDRYSGIAVGLTVAALVLVAVIVGQQLLGGDDGVASTNSDQVVEADQTSSTGSDASAGAGDDGAANTAATVTSTTARTTTSPASSAAPTTNASATTATSAATTSTTEATTSSSTTSTTEATTTTTEATTTTTETTTTTSTTTTTTTIPALTAPTGVTAVFRISGVLVNWQAAPQQGLTNYTVYRDGAPIGNAGATRSRFVDGNVGAGETYSYQVRANGPAGGSPASSPLSGAAVVTIPGEPD